MPHGGPHYKIYGTNEPYTGLTVEIGGTLYSTEGGTLEGFSMQLIPTNGEVNTLDSETNLNNQTMGIGGQSGVNPNQDQQNQLMGIGGQSGVNPNQDQQNQLMSGPGVNPNQDLQDTTAY